jgi:hypothetical protein
MSETVGAAGEVDDGAVRVVDAVAGLVVEGPLDAVVALLVSRAAMGPFVVPWVAIEDDPIVAFWLEAVVLWSPKTRPLWFWPPTGMIV